MRNQYQILAEKYSLVKEAKDIRIDNLKSLSKYVEAKKIIVSTPEDYWDVNQWTEWMPIEYKGQEYTVFAKWEYKHARVGLKQRPGRSPDEDEPIYADVPNADKPELFYVFTAGEEAPFYISSLVTDEEIIKDVLEITCQAKIDEIAEATMWEIERNRDNY